jgi:hypothetical protein
MVAVRISDRNRNEIETQTEIFFGGFGKKAQVHFRRANNKP